MAERKSYKEVLLNSKMKRNWIVANLQKLSHEQVDLLFSMVKRWLRELEAS